MIYMHILKLEIFIGYLHIYKFIIKKIIASNCRYYKLRLDNKWKTTPLHYELKKYVTHASLSCCIDYWACITYFFRSYWTGSLPILQEFELEMFTYYSKTFLDFHMHYLPMYFALKYYTLWISCIKGCFHLLATSVWLFGAK